MISAEEYARLDGVGLHRLVRTGEIAPSEVHEAARAAVAAAVGTNAFIAECSLPMLNEDRNGAFAGIPIGVKDLGNATAGDPNREGMRLLRDIEWRSTTDEGISVKLRAENAIFMGRTSSSELGVLPSTEPAAFGPTINPRAPGRSPGGSSGGSAAAVASGAVPIAVGSDGGGSIRIPASSCGLIGLKPSRGRISAGPHHGELWAGLGTFGFLTRSVRDTAHALDVVSGPMLGDPYASPAFGEPFSSAIGRPPGTLRIGYVTSPFRHNVASDPDCFEAVEDAAKLLRTLGHSVVESRPIAFQAYDEMRRHMGRVVSVNIAARLAMWSKRLDRLIREEDVEPVTATTAKHGRRHSGVSYLESVSWSQHWARQLAAWWREFDVLLTPTMPTLPPKIGAWSQTDPYEALRSAAHLTHFTAPFNVSGQPAISLPLGVRRGAPVGLQFVGSFGSEPLLLQLAAQLEAQGALEVTDRKEAMSA